MRIDGTLAKWNDDRGFGFIAPVQGGPEVFAHISAFPRDGRRPRLGEPLSFEIEIDKDGRKRAMRDQLAYKSMGYDPSQVACSRISDAVRALRGRPGVIRQPRS